MTTMTMPSQTSSTDLDEATMRDLSSIEERVKAYSLADAIREGSAFTTQAHGWGDGETSACAMTAAVVAARKHGYM